MNISNIANKISDITVDDLEKTIDTSFKQDNKILIILSNEIDYFLEDFKIYEMEIAKFESVQNVFVKQQILDKQIDLIYRRFFTIQNLFNAFLGQKIILTQVYTDDSGYRKVVVSENTVDHLSADVIDRFGKPYAKLNYNLPEHYTLLKNSLPDSENEGLQETAKEVENRYVKYKHKILWKYNNSWKGYKLMTRGPINEAFVNFYIHDIKLQNSIKDHNINTFMLDRKYGAINADNRYGFLIGDVEKNGVQYAVKGAFGGPQGFKQIKNAFLTLKNMGYNELAFNQFIKKFYKQEKEKSIKPQITELSKRSLSQTLRYIEKDLTK